jgi:hypothetical protein
VGVFSWPSASGFAVCAKNAPRTLLSYLFGRISPNPSFHIWDHDAIEFIFSLQRTLPSLNTLATTLGTNNLLFLGSDFSDWLARFFLRVIKGKPLKEEALPFLLAERRMRLNPESVLFYNALKGHIEIVHESPIEFAREFVARALRGFALAEEPAAQPLPAVDREIPEGAIFVSYCHIDREFAFRVTEKLQRHGCLVWLDRDRLQAGDNFENEFEDAIKRCVLFLSLITPSTEGRIKSYFHKERGWAELQATMFAPGETFYVPVASEGTRSPVQREPRRFADIHIEIAVGGNISDDLCERLRFLQQERIRRR